MISQMKEMKLLFQHIYNLGDFGLLSYFFAIINKNVDGFSLFCIYIYIFEDKFVEVELYGQKKDPFLILVLYIYKSPIINGSLYFWQHLTILKQISPNLISNLTQFWGFRYHLYPEGSQIYISLAQNLALNSRHIMYSTAYLKSPLGYFIDVLKLSCSKQSSCILQYGSSYKISLASVNSSHPFYYLTPFFHTYNPVCQQIYFKYIQNLTTSLQHHCHCPGSAHHHISLQ